MPPIAKIFPPYLDCRIQLYQCGAQHMTHVKGH